MKRIGLATALWLVSGSALAQTNQPAATVIAVPPLTTPTKGAAGNDDLALGWQATQLIVTDLKGTSELMPLPPAQKDYYSYPEVTAPNFPNWRSAGVKALVTGFVQSRSDGRVTVGCYVYDVDKGRELGRTGFIVGKNDWRRAAHKCSGLAYKAITGAPGVFDTRITYVAESGGANMVRRIAVMDSDGFNHDYVTAGGTMVLTPHLSPDSSKVTFVSYMSGIPHVRVLDIGSGNQRDLIQGDMMSFAPHFSPDGKSIAFSMMLGANSDIYIVGANGGLPRRLTTAPGIDTDPSFSPDGSQIVFESDRGGNQQLYVMNSDGSNERRLTFGGGQYAAPDWSPDGKSIVFTRRDGGIRRIGVIGADGSGERQLTQGPNDEGANWAASSRELIFQRTDASGRNGLFRLTLDGSAPRQVSIPQAGSDPNWSGRMD